VSEQPVWKNPTSKKGWVNIDYDRTIWIPCLPIFPDGYDLESWSAEFAQAWWEVRGLTYGGADVARLTEMLIEIQKNTYGHMPCHHAFIHLPDPRLMPLMLYVCVWELEGERDEQLRALTHADDAEAVEPPIVEEFSTDKLGGGLRTLRYVHLNEDKTLYAALNYAWRSEEHETDVRVWTSSEDLGRLQRAIPDIDDFARTITVISRDELHD
jgi:hypothetical protein